MISGQRLKVVHLRWAEDIGGPEHMLRNLAVYTDQERVEMAFIFLARGGPYEQELRSMGYSVDVIHARNGYDPVMRTELALKLRAFQPDIVVEHGVPPLVRPIVKLVTRAPLLSFDHGQIEISRRQGKPWINWLNKIEHRFFCAQIICNSTANAQQIIDEQSISSSRVRVVQLGINLANFKFLETPSIDDSPSELILGYAGRLQNYDKGTDYLPHLANQLVLKGLVDFKIMLIGSGPDENSIRELAHNLSVSERMIFCGHKSNVAEWMSRFDILLVPSRTEAFGLVAVEALAVGTRVVAFDVGGLRETVFGCSSARLIAPGDIAAMADAVLDLWKNCGKERPIEARQYVESRFDARRMTEEMMAIYQEFGC